MIDLNILTVLGTLGLLITIIGTLGTLMWWLIKPIRESLGELREEVTEVRKDVKQNGERIARIEGIIWADIDKFIKKNKGPK